MMDSMPSTTCGSRKSAPRRALGAWVVSLCAAAALVPSPARAAESCQFLLDSALKMMTTGSHTYTTRTSDRDAPLLTEGIYVNGQGYIMVDGKWSRGMSVAEIKAQSEENLKTEHPVCTKLREESVDGQLAAVYGEHSADDATVTMRVWIAKASGLQLREEIDMNTGGAKGKSHYLVRYTYNNVAPPSGVK
jgi:hypothetical protein